MPGLRNGRLLLRELAGRLLVKLVPAMRSDRFQMVLVGVCLTSALVGARQQRGLSVRGVVLDGVTKRPVAEATVALVGMAGSSSRTETDGRFFLSLQRPAAGLRLQATKPGYLTGYLGQLGPNDTLGSTFDLTDGQQLDNLVVRLWPAGSIVGRVTNERGDPIVKASVVALTRTIVGGSPRWWRATVPVSTDDRGEYRLERLPPNSYAVAIRPLPSVSNGMVPALAFSPGVRSISAATEIAVAGDLQRADATIGPAPGARAVAGRLVGGDRSTLGMVVRLTGAGASGEIVGFDDLAAKADAEGRFVFPSVPFGAYRIQVCEFPRMEVTPYSVGGDFNRTLTGFLGARPPDFPRIPALPSEPTWVADQQIEVREDLAPSLDVTLQPGARIRGRVEFHGRRDAPAPGELLTIPVVVRPADGGQSLDVRGNVIPQPRIEADGRFVSAGLLPGPYVIGFLPNLAPLKGWYLSGVAYQGVDVTGKSLALEFLMPRAPSESAFRPANTWLRR